MVIEGRWKITKTYNNGSVELVNIYNGNKIKLCKNQYMGVVNGNTTISKIISSRLKRGICKKSAKEKRLERLEKLNLIENGGKEWLW